MGTVMLRAYTVGDCSKDHFSFHSVKYPRHLGNVGGSHLLSNVE